MPYLCKYPVLLRRHLSAPALQMAQLDCHAITLGMQAKLLANVVSQLLVRAVFKVLEKGQRKTPFFLYIYIASHNG